MIENFCKYCILQGAEIFPLNVSSDDSAHLGICNPSIFDDGKDVYLTLRNVNYMLYDNKNINYQTYYGEMVYVTPDNDVHLRTRNYICKYSLEENKIKEYNLIDTSDFDVEPVWEFIGHEDVRVVRWNNKLYVTGCRRDVKDNGESRMELSEIDPKTGQELSRVRIKAPGDDTSYCEKNWVPVIDKPFHYIKWTNPTELVKVDPKTGDCESLFIKEQDQSKINTFRALRGSSQVIPFSDGYIALMHEVDVMMNELNRKDPQYYMKWVVFDDEFNIIKTSDEFKFLNCSIEFTNGLMHKDGIFYIPFSIMDNISFIMKVPEQIVIDFINSETDKENYTNIKQKDNIYKSLCLEEKNPEYWFSFGELLEGQHQHSQAATCYMKALEIGGQTLDDTYRYAYSLAKSFSEIGYRDYVELSLWENCIIIDPTRSEAYENIARYYKYRSNKHTSYMYAKMAYELNNYKRTTKYSDVDSTICEIIYYEMLYYCGNKDEAYLKLIDLHKFLSTDTKNSFYFNYVEELLDTIKNNRENIRKLV